MHKLDYKLSNEKVEAYRKQIIKALKQNEQGRKAEDIYREPDHRNTGTAKQG